MRRAAGMRTRLAAGVMAAAIAVALAVSGRARADGIDEAWKRGNDAYFRGDYSAAIAAFTELDRQGIVSPDLFANLGLAYFRQGQLGRAIWALERAVALDPDADDARFNLEQIRKQNERRAVDKIEGAQHDPLWIRLVMALPTSTETWLFLACYIGCFAVLFIRRRAGEDHKASLGAGAALLGLGAALVGLLLLGRAAIDRIPFAIVLAEEVPVKEGADPNYRTSFQVHAGLKVRLLDRDHDWVRIRLPNGLEGWVRDSSVGRL
jgi:tetratricopeptide (TPR) repeat protein